MQRFAIFRAIYLQPCEKRGWLSNIQYFYICATISIYYLYIYYFDYISNFNFAYSYNKSFSPHASLSKLLLTHIIINLTLALIPYTYNSRWDFCSKIHVPVTSFCCFFTKLSSCDFMSFYQFSISLLLDMPVWIFLYLSTASSAASFSSFCSTQATLQISTYDLLCVFCFIRFRDMQHFFFFPCLSLTLSFSRSVRAFAFTGFAGSFTVYLSKVDTHEWSLKCLASVLNGYAHALCIHKYTYVYMYVCITVRAQYLRRDIACQSSRNR